jgi:predicted transport protein
LEDHLTGAAESTKQLFSELRSKIQSLDGSTEERPKKKYIAYRAKNAFVYVKIQRAQLKVWLIPPKSKLEDPRNLTRDVTEIGHHGGGDTEIILSDLKDINYVMGLIEQSYNAVALI